MTEAVLKLRDVSLSFKGIKALNALSFEVARGEICALIGPNGAGKSSLLNIINGVYRADSGSVTLDGEQFVRIRPAHAAHLGVGRTFQHNALFRHLSVLDNVLAGLIRHSRTTLIEHAFGFGRDRSETHAFSRRADEIIAFLDLTRHRDKVAATLPYGVQKRVDLARALVGRPSLLLLDEPSLGLAPLMVHLIFQMIIRIRQEGTAILLVEQNARAALKVADYGYVMEGGRIVLEGPAADLAADDRVQSAYLGGRGRRLP